MIQAIQRRGIRGRGSTIKRLAIFYNIFWLHRVLIASWLSSFSYSELLPLLLPSQATTASYHRCTDAAHRSTVLLLLLELKLCCYCYFHWPAAAASADSTLHGSAIGSSAGRCYSCRCLYHRGGINFSVCWSSRLRLFVVRITFVGTKVMQQRRNRSLISHSSSFS